MKTSADTNEEVKNMKRLLSTILISALLVTGGVFAFAGTSHAADATTTQTAVTTTSFGSPFIDSLVKLLNLDQATIVARRQSGESLVAIAAAQGISEEKLIDTLKAAHLTRIDELVAAGRLTTAQADACRTNLDAAVKAAIERTATGPNGARCTGLGNGAGNGAGNGNGLGNGTGAGCGYMAGRGAGRGQGLGLGRGARGPR